MDTKQKASGFAVASAFTLAVSKFAAGLMSGSMAVVSSGLDSLLDVFMSAMNLFAIRTAAQPADERHKYGHEKAECIASLVQAIVIITSGVVIIYKAVAQLLHGGSIAYTGLDIGVMAVSLVFSLVISTVLRKIGRKTNSAALKADALHYASDLYSNSAAIVAIILTHYTGKTMFDVAFAVITGFIIILSAVKILRDGIYGLMDSSLPQPVEQEIESVIGSMPFPCAGYHKLRTRLSGSKNYIDFHLLACRNLHIDEAHKLAHEIENRIKVRLVIADIVIHVEPCEHQCALTEMTCLVLKSRKGRARTN